MTALSSASNAADIDLPAIDVTVELVTPELAERYLQDNIGNNRRLNPKRVSYYAAQMRNGHWNLAGSISFDCRGRLFDGQHRMKAVKESGVSVPFVITRGYPEQACQFVDMNATRNAANVAALQGVKAGTRELAVARSMLIPRFTRPIATPHEVLGIFKKYEASIRASISKYGNGRNNVAHSGIRAAIARAHAWGENYQRLGEFVEVLSSGYSVSSNPTDDTAAIALRNHYLGLINENSTRIGGGDFTQRLFYRTQGAIKNFLARKDVRMVRETKQSFWPLPDIDDEPLHKLVDY